jgi:AraC-like DNA-binding protein/mannose-6-phosphate isomerase-like protein (cupin superfamily)
VAGGSEDGEKHAEESFHEVRWISGNYADTMGEPTTSAYQISTSGRDFDVFRPIPRDHDRRMTKRSEREEDVQEFGADTRYVAVRATESDRRSWLGGALFCPTLDPFDIAHVGVMDAASPFEVVRNQQSGTFMLACFEGEGTVWIDGRWVSIRPGQACLQPPFIRNALRCVKGRRWGFAWVRYEDARERTPMISALSPITGSYDPSGLLGAIRGLHGECSGQGAPAALHHWAHLIQHYVLRFARPHEPDSRLWRLWQKVSADLARPWTLGEMAGIACVSEEHLRRLCKREIGRSPKQHLIFLRLQEAATRLSSSDEKVEVIAREVGFESAFTFSNTFKRWIGWRPSEHRLRLR